MAEEEEYKKKVKEEEEELGELSSWFADTKVVYTWDDTNTHRIKRKKPTYLRVVCVWVQGPTTNNQVIQPPLGGSERRNILNQNL